MVRERGGNDRGHTSIYWGKWPLLVLIQALSASGHSCFVILVVVVPRMVREWMVMVMVRVVVVRKRTCRNKHKGGFCL